MDRLAALEIFVRVVDTDRLTPSHLEAQRSSRIPSGIDIATVEPVVCWPTRGDFLESDCTTV
jgi:hypothetical protein